MQEIKVGDVFGTRTVQSGPHKKHQSRRALPRWTTECKCGARQDLTHTQLLANKTCKQCFLARANIRPGDKIGEFTVIWGPSTKTYTYFGKDKVVYYWEVRCPSGHIKHVRTGSIKNLDQCESCQKAKIDPKGVKVGDRFGLRKVVDGPHRRPSARCLGSKTEAYWTLECECGEQATLPKIQFVNTVGCQRCARYFKLHGRKRVDYKVGEKVGILTVIGGPEHRGESRRRRWMVRCECGVEWWARPDELKTEASQSGCGQCRLTKRDQAYRADRPENLRGIEDSQYRKWKQILSGAQGRGIAVSVSAQEAFSVLEEQGFRCALTGERLTLPRSMTDKDATASLDRIDSDMGYAPGNIQWVHKTVNHLKNAFGQDEFVRWCELVTYHAKRRNAG